MPDRIAWVVDLLDIGPDERVLEFGCGTGVAVGLGCERLDGGRLTAIDRSAVAVERARARNTGHVAAGRAVLEQVDLAGFAGEPRLFDKAFGVDVNLFWTGAAAAECEVLARVLRHEGRLVLVYAGPGPGEARDVGPGIAATLERHGFAAETGCDPTGAMLCVIGRLTRRV